MTTLEDLREAVRAAEETARPTIVAAWLHPEDYDALVQHAGVPAKPRWETEYLARVDGVRVYRDSLVELGVPVVECSDGSVRALRIRKERSR